MPQKLKITLQLVQSIVSFILISILFTLLLLSLISNHSSIQSQLPKLRPPKAIAAFLPLVSLYCGLTLPSMRYFIWQSELISRNESIFTHQMILLHASEHPAAGSLKSYISSLDICNPQITGIMRQSAFAICVAAMRDLSTDKCPAGLPEIVLSMLKVAASSQSAIKLSDMLRIVLAFWNKVRIVICQHKSSIINGIVHSSPQHSSMLDNIQHSEFVKDEINMIFDSLFARWLREDSLWRVWDCLIALQHEPEIMTKFFQLLFARILMLNEQLATSNEYSYEFRKLFSAMKIDIDSIISEIHCEKVSIKQIK